MTKRILLVEDDKRINELVSDYLETSGYEVDCAYDGIKGLSMFNESDYSLVILDIMMPGLDGWSLCRRIRKNSDVLIIILTARSDEDDKLMGFELGADEYVTKPFSPKVLVARVNALLERFTNIGTEDEVFSDGCITIDKRTLSVSVDRTVIALTSKEFSMLSVLVSDPGRVFPRETLIQKIWGYDYFGDGRVVDTNIKTLRKKLGKCSDSIATVIGVGYKYVPAEAKK